jgi:alginate O-acetyltransferase complex protein AlgJ
MKRFFITTIVFTIPLLIWVIIEGLLPSYAFTYRPWEALDFQTAFHLDRTFHPNSELRMISVGQLCHHTKYAVKMEETWITDELGNRNNTYIKDPDILIVGDSFAAGCAVTQDSIIANMLFAELDGQMKIYSIAPAEFPELDNYLKSNTITKPKMVVYLKSERYVPRPMKYYREPSGLKSEIKDKIKGKSVSSHLSIFLDKSLRHYSKNWVHARLSRQKGDGIPGIEGSNMFFFNEENYRHDVNMVKDFTTDLKRTNDIIVSYKEYCDSLGIEFLFIPMPNKATVYYEFVPFKEQPGYILKLDSMLRAENVKTINSLKLYNDYRKSNNELLYHLDDTHWNSNAIRIVSEEAAKTIISALHNYLDRE